MLLVFNPIHFTTPVVSDYRAFSAAGPVEAASSSISGWGHSSCFMTQFWYNNILAILWFFLKWPRFHVTFFITRLGMLKGTLFIFICLTVCGVAPNIWQKICLKIILEKCPLLFRHAPNKSCFKETINELTVAEFSQFLFIRWKAGLL